MGVTLPSIDAMLARIDRALAPPFVLPIGGPVPVNGAFCWRDRPSTVRLHGGHMIVCCDVIAGDNALEMCQPHYDQFMAAA